VTSLTRHRLTDDFAADYRRDGFVVLTDLVELDRMLEARERVLSLFAARLGHLAPELAPGELLLELYRREPALWHQCARRMWDVLPVYGLGSDDRVILLLEKLDLRSPIVSTRPEVRTDMPDDERYMQPWHQDWRYGQGSVNSVTLWLPLQDVDASNGTIELMAGSHLYGYLGADELSNPRRFAIPDEALPALPIATAELKFGETIVFSQFLAHRSGHNVSGRPRITVQARFTDALEPRFLEQGYPTPDGSKLVWDEPPGEPELRVAFGRAGSELTSR
jgi:phytanoyl-CoA hydroxylase